MADVRKTIEILFKGVDQASSTIKDISGGIDDFAGNVGKISGPLADLGTKALVAEGAVLGLASAFVGYAYTATEKYESAALDLQKVMSDSEGSVDDYRGEILRLSNTYGQLSGDVLGGVTQFKLAGFEMNESVSLMEDSIKLLIAGDIEANTATEILVTTLKGFKAPAEDAARITDILNEVSNKYATNVEELGIGMAHLSPIANLMGFSFEETAGILTPVIEIFRSGSEASNALKVGLLKLLDDSKPVQDALARLGVAQKDTNGQLRSGRDILFDVGEAFKYADENDKLFLTSQLVGIRQAGRMIEVFNGMSKAQEITTVAMGAGGSAMKEVEIRLNSIEVAGSRAAVAFNNLMLAVGESLKVEITGLVNSFTNLAGAITESIDGGDFNKLIDIIKPIVLEVQDLFNKMAENIPAALKNIKYDGLASSLENLKGEFQDAFAALFGDIDLGTAEGLEIFIQKIVDGVSALTNVTAGIMDVWEPFLKILGSAIERFSEGSEGAQEFAGEILGWAQVVDKVVNNIGILTGSLNLLGGSLALIGSAQIGGLVIKNFDSISGAAVKLVPLLKSAGVGLVNFAGAGASFGTGWMVGSTLRLMVPEIDDWTQQMWGAIDSVINFTGTQGKQRESLEETKRRLQENLEKVAAYKKKIDEASQSKLTTTVEVVAEGKDAEIVKGMLDGSIDRETGMASWAAGLDVPWIFKPELDKESVEQFKKDVNTDILEWWDAEGNYHQVVVQLDPSQVKQETDKIPSEKEIELRIKGEYDIALAEIEANAEIMQKAMELEAKVDIAQIEAQAKVVVAAFDSINVGIQSTGEVISGMMGIWANASLSEKYDLENYIRKEYELRDKEFELQEKLINSEATLNKAKEKFYAGEGGEAKIIIETSEVYPELDMVMLSMIKRAQVKANALGMATLLGIQES